MIALARNRAISDAVLVSGDEDLRVGVQQAQEFGVRVHLVGIKPSRGSQSLFLLQEADTLTSGRRMKSRCFSSASRVSFPLILCLPSFPPVLSRVCKLDWKPWLSESRRGSKGPRSRPWSSLQNAWAKFPATSTSNYWAERARKSNAI